MMEYAIDILTDIQHRIGGGVVYLDAEDRPKLRAFYETEATFKLFGERLSEIDGIVSSIHETFVKTTAESAACAPSYGASGVSACVSGPPSNFFSPDSNEPRLFLLFQVPAQPTVFRKASQTERLSASLACR